jgi:hypothetical protein
MNRNVSGAQRELLKYYASVTSNRWLMLKIFGVLIIFVSTSLWYVWGGGLMVVPCVYPCIVIMMYLLINGTLSDIKPSRSHGPKFDGD